MKLFLCVVLAVAAVAAGCGQKSPSTVQATNAPPPAADSEYSNPLNAPAQYLGVLGAAQKLANKTVDKASVDRAIQMFYNQEERFPRNLQELVIEHFIPALPKEPYGMRFVYNPQNGDFRVIPAPPQAAPAAGNQ